MDTLQIENNKSGSLFKLIVEDKLFNGAYDPDKVNPLLTIAWNKGEDQRVEVEGKMYDCPTNSLIALVSNQYFEFEKPVDIIAWQFNKPFYCIIDHDEEVSCSGLLFYGSSNQPIVQLSEKDSRKINLLYQVFLEEFADKDNLQEDMLRMLLKRLIITTTRIYKAQNGLKAVESDVLDLVRQFNLLVEKNYKQWHQVQDYANELFKSPKTLSNVFSKYHSKSPLKVIHERIILEAKRLLIYRDYSIKEIAYELGFEEIPPFNRLFKKITGMSPSAFRKAQ